ncbi:hypothetical protein [Bacillus sp. FJAT-28004]|uniref:hypothetical protein n=1 Tax=Bacillus sp. FJAT-28004 TaxID=1679165 RepID=UPI0006B61090|nr:hypothetical protein [Bacillus sp. FJAT-28004]
MRIKSKDTHDGGGNCRLVELLIEDGGELLSITITEEWIVGRKIPFIVEDCEKDYDYHEVVLWAANDAESLKYIPEEIKLSVLEAYHEYCKNFNRDLDITKV